MTNEAKTVWLVFWLGETDGDAPSALGAFATLKAAEALVDELLAENEGLTRDDYGFQLLPLIG